MTAANHRILIVDDDKVIAAGLESVLSEAGYAVSTASDGVEGLRSIWADPPDLVLLDLMMPRMTGYQVCRLLKSESGYASIPVAILTSQDKEFDERRSLVTGADAFLTKDMPPETILARVRELLAAAPDEPRPPGREFSDLQVITRLNELLDLRVHVLTVLEEAVRLMNMDLSADRIQGILLDAATRGLGFRRAALWRPSGRSMICVNFSDQALAWLQGQALDADATPWLARALEDRKPIPIRPSPLQDLPGFPGPPDPRSLAVAAPVLAGERVVGLIMALDRETHTDSISPAQVNALSLLANQAGVAMENLGLIQRLEEKSESLQRQAEELKSLQTQLIQASKIAAIGQIAGGVAHEINNPLSSVLGYSQYLLKRLRKSAPESKAMETVINNLEIIETSAKRCKTIADNLLSFSRTSGEEDFNRIAPAQALKDAAALLRYHFTRAGVEFEFEFDDEFLAVDGNFNQLQQVFTNLIINAVDAMPEGGRLVIGLKRAVIEQAGPPGDKARPRYVELIFRDTGCGVAPEIKDKIFDPFFTTKPPGKGTGLGLSISYGIVQNHGGFIDVDNEPGGGAVFRVFLPEADGPAPGGPEGE